MNAFARSWELFRASLSVLRADKELIIFPLISGVACLLVTISFAVPALFTGVLDVVQQTDWVSRIIGFAIVFLYYLAQYFVIYFANTALVGAALIRLRGGDPTVGDGLRIAFQRFGAILGYALIAATVGMILRMFSKRGVVGQIVSSLIGLVWNLATYLVVPILAVENVGPIEAIKRSANYLKRTWGEQIVGESGIGLIMFLMLLPVFVLGVVALVVVPPSLMAFGIVALVIVLAILTAAILNGTLSGIYAAAVYQYAAEGKTSSQFSTELVRGAFRSK